MQPSILLCFTLTLACGQAPETTIASKTLPTLKLARIPAKGKTFTMGSPKTEKALLNRSDKEEEHSVTFTADFYMGVTEVTRGQFAAFVEDTKYDSVKWKAAGFAQTDEHPVVNVCWIDATKFCEWLSKKDEREYQLPTEAQWEYACRAGSKTRFSFGDDELGLGQHGNVPDEAFRSATGFKFGIKSNDGYAYTAPVGRFKKNAFGLYDMHGNVAELCADWYAEYPSAAATDPMGPAKGQYRLRRGGCWTEGLLESRSATRNWEHPTVTHNYVGFRISAPATSPSK